LAAGVLGLTGNSCSSLDKLVENEPIPIISNSGYENSSVNIDDSEIQQMLDSALRIEVSVTYENVITREQYMSHRIGTGFPVEYRGETYIVSAKHMIPEQLEMDVRGPLNLVSHSYRINGKKISPFKSALVEDAAIFTIEDAIEGLKPVTVGTESLECGDTLYAVGFPMDRGKFISQGIVTARIVDEYFFLSAPINPGNSSFSSLSNSFIFYF